MQSIINTAEKKCNNDKHNQTKCNNDKHNQTKCNNNKHNQTKCNNNKHNPIKKLQHNKRNHKIYNNKKHNNKQTQQQWKVKQNRCKNYYVAISCIFRNYRANKPVRFDQQKSLVTDQQNWANQIAKKKISKIQILSKFVIFGGGWVGGGVVGGEK